MKIPEQDDFDKTFNEVQRQATDTFKTVAVLSAFGSLVMLLLGLAIFGGLGYVAWHFLAKVW